jgi:hypothetical protein
MAGHSNHIICWRQPKGMTACQSPGKDLLSLAVTIPTKSVDLAILAANSGRQATQPSRLQRPPRPSLRARTISVLVPRIFAPPGRPRRILAITLFRCCTSVTRNLMSASGSPASVHHSAASLIGDRSRGVLAMARRRQARSVSWCRLPGRYAESCRSPVLGDPDPGPGSVREHQGHRRL